MTTLSVELLSGTVYQETATGATGTIAPDSAVNINLDTQAMLLRFSGITIPMGALINSAILSLRMQNFGGDRDQPLHTFAVVAEDDASIPATGGAGTFGILAKALTSNTVLWDNADLGVSGAALYSPPDLAAAVQEVIDRAGWVSGNHLAIVYRGSSNSARNLEATYVSTNTFPPIPKIDLVYTITPRARLNGTSAIVANAQITRQAISVFVGEATLTALPLFTIAGIVALASVATITAESRTIAAQAALASVAAVAALGVIEKPAVALLAGESALAAVATVTHAAIASLAAEAAVTAVGNVRSGFQPGVAVLAAEAAVTAIGDVHSGFQPGVAPLTAVSTVTALGSCIWAVQALLVTVVTLTARPTHRPFGADLPVLPGTAVIALRPRAGGVALSLRPRAGTARMEWGP